MMIAYYNHASSLVLRMGYFKPLLHEMNSWIEKHHAHLDTCYWEIVSVQKKGGWGVSPLASPHCRFLMSYQTFPVCQESLHALVSCA